jgi:hypothetical protein
MSTRKAHSMASGWRAAAFASFLGACGTQYADPILGAATIADSGRAQDALPTAETGSALDAAVSNRTDGNVVSEADAPMILSGCERWTTSADCLADTAHGCSFQPNAVGCHIDDSTCAPGTCLGSDPFVRRFGATLQLHGAPFSFVGTVSWGISGDSSSSCRVTAYPTQDAALIRTFDDLADMRVSAFRVWAFQSYAGASGTDYSKFDKVVNSARQAGVRLIMVLENYWGDCTLGGQRNDTWFASGYRSPYAGYPLSLVDYVSGLVKHFRDEPAILAWEVMHEAAGDDFATLDAFGQDMASVIRAQDPNHLIALGFNNGDSPATSNVGEPSNYQQIHDHDGIDLVDVHDLNSPDVALTAGLTRDAAIAVALGKPAFAGASAVSLASTSPGDFQARADAMTNKLTAAFSAGYAGFLIYDYVPGWQSAHWEFDGRAADPLAGPQGVLAQNARINR